MISTNFPDKDTRVMIDHRLKSALSYHCSKANIILGNINKCHKIYEVIPVSRLIVSQLEYIIQALQLKKDSNRPHNVHRRMIRTTRDPTRRHIIIALLKHLRKRLKELGLYIL